MPLLDVVFLLLTFFAFALLLMVRAEVLNVELPVVEAGEASRPPGQPIVLTIQSDGSFAVETQPIEDAQILDRVRAAQSERPEAPVVLEVDVGAPSGRLIELVQTLRTGGVDRFGILGRTDPNQNGASSSGSGSGSAAGSGAGSAPGPS
jgi:biopolymer transport protein ExbD